MTIETQPQRKDPEDPDTYCQAVVLAFQARRAQGNGSVYDKFLCSHIGDPHYGSTEFPPRSRRMSSGAEYHYNNPLNMLRSYTPEGTMLNVRWAQGFVDPEEYADSVMVATADLRTDTITEWQVTDVESRGPQHRRTMTLRANAWHLFSVVTNDESEAGDRFAASIARREQASASMARLVLDPAGPNVFIPYVGLDQQLEDATGLVQDVNQLTDYYQLDLETLRRTYEQRTTAAQQLAKVIPLAVPWAA